LLEKLYYYFEIVLLFYEVAKLEVEITFLWVKIAKERLNLK
jgi:hypothetical protein